MGEKTRFCKAPWQQMVIMVHGTVTPCCFWHDEPIGNVCEQSLFDIWNNEKYKELRANHLEGKLTGTGCELCIKHGLCKWMFDLHYDERCLQESPPYSKYRQNIELLREEIANKSTILQAMPTRLQLSPSVDCNIRCVHCYQHNIRNKRLSAEGLFDDVKRLVPSMDQLLASGGEPLFIPFWLSFFDDFQTDSNPYMQLSFNTNGMILTDSIKKNLSKFGRLLVSISMDAASAELFEQVHLKAKYPRVMAHLQEYKKLVHDKSDSSVQLTAALMKPNIHEAAQMIALAANNGITIGFGFVGGPALELSVTSFNDADAEMAGWQEYLDEAKKMAQERFGDRPEDFKALMGSLRTVESVIPWGCGSNGKPISLDVTPYLQEELSSVTDRISAYLKFHPLEPKPAVACSYYSPIKDGMIQLKMPPGKYAVQVLDDKYSAIAYFQKHDYQVHEDGKALFIKKKQGLKSKIKSALCQVGLMK